MGSRVHRITMFKIVDEEEQKKLIEGYKTLSKNQQKDGKPYILYMCAGRALDNPRRNGYTVVAKTEFASMEDMKYYDGECAAHGELKKLAATATLAEPPTTLFFEGTPNINAA